MIDAEYFPFPHVQDPRTSRRDYNESVIGQCCLANVCYTILRDEAVQSFDHL